MDLEKLNLVELNAQEVQETEGGLLWAVGLDGILRPPNSRPHRLASAGSPGSRQLQNPLRQGARTRHRP